jgi:formylglycine-generating enzyme required for sulfatase activity
VADWHTDEFLRSEVRNPKGPGSGEAKVIRGGGRFDPAGRITTTIRFHARVDTRGEDTGFRCAIG